MGTQGTGARACTELVKTGVLIEIPCDVQVARKSGEDGNMDAMVCRGLRHSLG